MTAPAQPAEAVQVSGLGRRYGAAWALRDCTFAVPAGTVTALVGANGAGKTTLLHVLAGLLEPTAGTASAGGAAAGRVASVSQDKPLYRRFTVQEMLRFGRCANRVWNQAVALEWLAHFDIPTASRCGALSGGQQTQVALALALGSCPSVLLLDEPLSDLDPLARKKVVAELLAVVAERGVTVVLSTHVVAELGGIADRLLLLSTGRMLLAGDVDDLVSGHTLLTGPAATTPPGPGTVVHADHGAGQSRFLVRDAAGDSALLTPHWRTTAPTLEDIVLGYLEAGVPA